MDFLNYENYLNRFCAAVIFYVGLLIVVLTLMPESIIPVQLPSTVMLFMGSGRISPDTALAVFYALIVGAAFIVTAAVVLYPRRIISEINFWLLIAIFLILPFAYSRDTKENFLLVKETTLRLFLISMFAIFLFRKLATGSLYDALRRVPWHLYAFTAFAACSFVWSASKFMTFHYSMILASYLIFYIVTTDTLRKPWQFYSISDILITAAAVASMYGILQYYRVAGTNHNYDPLFGVGEVIGNTDRKRVFSFFGNPVFLGVYLDAALPIAFAMFFSSFAAGARWAHKYEKLILRTQIIFLAFAITYCFVFMGLANSSVNSLIEASKMPGGPAVSDSKVSDLITSAGSTSFIIAPVVFSCLLFGAFFLYQAIPYWQEHEKQIYRLANGLFSFLAIFVCIFVTFTRTAWIATAASLFFFAVYVLFFAHDLIYAYRKWIIAFTIVVIISTIFLTVMYFKPNPLNTGTESIAGRFTSSFTVLQRIMLYDITLNIIKLSPVIGHGFGTYGKFYPEHQALFYKGEFRRIIDWINSFFKHILPNKSINFAVWSFEKVTTSRFFQVLMICYFIIFVLGGMLLLIYYKDIAARHASQLRATVTAYLLAITLPVLFVFLRFLSVKKSYLGLDENIMSVNPKDYFWLSAGFSHVHNEYLQVWSDLGIFALALFLYVFYDYFYKGGSLLNKLKGSPDRVIIIGYLCAVVAMLVESLANFPFQRIMPILVATVGFAMIFNGRRVFGEQIEACAKIAAEGDPDAAAAPLPPSATAQPQARAYNYSARDAVSDEPLYDDHLALASMPRDEREHLKQNLAFYAVVSVSVLALNYFPARYVLGNIDLKSGHTFISQAQMVRNEEEKFRVIIMEGLRYLERSVSRVPYNSEAIFWWGDTLKLLGRYDEAIEKFNEALRYTSTKHVYYSRGTAFFEKYKLEGKPEFMEQAKSDWKRAIEINPNFPQPLFHLGYHEFHAGNFKQAVEYFKEAIKWDNNEGLASEAYKFAGISAYYLKEDTEAIELMGEAHKRGARGVSKYLGGLLLNRGRYEEALPCLEDASRENPGDREVYASLVAACQKLGLIDRALEIVNQRHPSKDTAEYFYESGRLYAAQKNFDKALIDLGRGLEKFPDNIKINEEIGRIYFDEKKNYQLAATFFEKLTKLEPDNLRTLYNLGACYFRTGNFEKARETWENIKKRDPKFPGIDEYIKSAERKAATEDIKTTVIAPGQQDASPAKTSETSVGAHTSPAPAPLPSPAPVPAGGGQTVETGVVGTASATVESESRN